MKFNDWLVVALVGVGSAFMGYRLADAPPDNPAPTPPDKPAPTPAPAPPKKPKPWGHSAAPAGLAGTTFGAIRPAGAKIAGPRFDDGTEISCDYPGERHRRNTASKGLGLCVFTSMHHAADWQDVPALLEMPQWMRQRGIPGGGYPSKVAQLIPQLCQERGLPTPDYVQVESNDLEILQAACASGRMPCVTYAVSPTGRYGGSRIAHMVNLLHLDEKHAVILDNNYPGENAYEWMSRQEFLRAYSGGRTGWAVIFLAPPPPPPPHNGGPRPARNGETRPVIGGNECGKESCTCGCRSSESCKCAAAKECRCSAQCTCGCNEGRACECAGSNRAANAPTHGVAWDQIGQTSRYRHGDYDVTRDDVLAAITSGIPADAKKRRVTVIGSKEDRVRFEADWKSGPTLSALTSDYVCRTYAPDHWHVAGYGFKTDGRPSVYVQEPDGTVLYRSDVYDADELATTLRRLRPDYDPLKDRRPLVPAGGRVPWGPVAVFGAGTAAALYLGRKRPSVDS